ncbi:MAG: adenine phosphoribosyltransferase [Calditrichaeota bacterium]|nr:MAG: adenine phosphoribosyltransferase [Calditrichota bacterium]
MDLKKKIRNVPDFPRQGIGFKDITTLIGDAAALRSAVRQMRARFAGISVDKIAGIESRGFIFAAILAYTYQVGMIPVRKPGKLPYSTINEDYDLEYGSGSLQIHSDAVQKGERILIVDDLLATGGTVAASARLIERLGGIVVGCCFLVELDFLNAREKLGNYRIESLVHYKSE